MVGFDINLKEFNLGDVLQFLCRLKKTGALRISGEINGEIYLQDGLVVHAVDDSEKGVEALLNLSFAGLEKAQFEIAVRSPEQTISEDIGKLAEDIEKRRVEYQEIKQHLPPRDTVLMKSTKELATTVALRRTDWQILALVDGKRSLGEVIVQSKLGAYEATKTVLWLKEKGLIYDPKEAERVMSGLIRYLEILLESFGQIGLNWLKSWAEIMPKNKAIYEAVNIDEERASITLKAQLSLEQINDFFKRFDEFLNLEGPKVYGRLLAKKKLDEFKKRIGQDAKAAR